MIRIIGSNKRYVTPGAMVEVSPGVLMRIVQTASREELLAQSQEGGEWPYYYQVSTDPPKPPFPLAIGHVITFSRDAMLRRLEPKRFKGIWTVTKCEQSVRGDSAYVELYDRAQQRGLQICGLTMRNVVRMERR